MPMKKILNALILTALALPAFASAAYNDVTVTTSGSFTVGSASIIVVASSATMESVTVTGTTLSLTLQASSTVILQAPGLQQLNNTLSSGVDYNVTSSCHASLSELHLTGGSGQSVITITPGASCADGGGGGGGGSGGGSGGGGGGGSSGITVPSTPTTPTTPAAATTPAVSNNTSALVAQLQSLIATLKSFGGTVSPSLEATLASLTSTTPASPGAFMRNLSVGMTGDDVKALQIYLNTHGYTITSSGPGSSGQETNRFGGLTRAALAKFQKGKGISPAAGYFGPKTRAAMNGM